MKHVLKPVFLIALAAIVLFASCTKRKQAEPEPRGAGESEQEPDGRIPDISANAAAASFFGKPFADIDLPMARDLTFDKADAVWGTPLKTSEQPIRNRHVQGQMDRTATRVYRDAIVSWYVFPDETSIAFIVYLRGSGHPFTHGVRLGMTAAELEESFGKPSMLSDTGLDYYGDDTGYQLVEFRMENRKLVGVSLVWNLD